MIIGYLKSLLIDGNPTIVLSREDVEKIVQLLEREEQRRLQLRTLTDALKMAIDYA